MSIIMLAAAGTRSSADHTARSTIEPSVRGLLDHLAVELAEEYIRLMEAAAAAKHDAPPIESEEDRKP